MTPGLLIFLQGGTPWPLEQSGTEFKRSDAGGWLYEFSQGFRNAGTMGKHCSALCWYPQVLPVTLKWSSSFGSPPFLWLGMVSDEAVVPVGSSEQLANWWEALLFLGPHHMSVVFQLS